MIIRSGAVFVWPLLQQYSFLDLQPMTLEFNIERGPFRATGTVVIGTSPDCLKNAVARLAELTAEQVKGHAMNILQGHLLETCGDADETASTSELTARVRTATEKPLHLIGLELPGLVILRK